MDFIKAIKGLSKDPSQGGMKLQNGYEEAKAFTKSLQMSLQKNLLPFTMLSLKINSKKVMSSSL
jgi:hypothetical protein